MLKQCLLHDGRIILGCKPLTSSVLHKPLIFREFASDGESARKFSLIFRGRTENPDEKTAGYLQTESGRIAVFPTENDNADAGWKQQAFYRNRRALNLYITVVIGRENVIGGIKKEMRSYVSLNNPPHKIINLTKLIIHVSSQTQIYNKKLPYYGHKFSPFTWNNMILK